MKIQNTFSLGIINKDVNDRFVKPNELIDAENYFVTTSESSEQGVGKNIPGNIAVMDLAVTNAKTIGWGADTNAEKIYNFVKSDTYDYIIEYDINEDDYTIVLQSSTGGALNFKTGERIRNVDVIYSGKDYDDLAQEGGNLLLFSGDTNPPRIININRAKTWGTNGFTAEEIMLIKAPPTYPVSGVLVNINSEENFIKEKFISFAYRYKYKDNYYSPISSWQEYSFIPGRFQLDLGSFENLGMINAFNACVLSFNTGPREVIAVDLLFKESNQSIVYKIDQFVKEDEGWSNNSTQTVTFDNSKVYSILPDDQYLRSGDDVPEFAYAQTPIGSRIAFGNYFSGKNLIDKNGDKVIMDYTVGFQSVANESLTVPITKLSTTSPFTPFPTIVNGKLRFDFTGAVLIKDSVVAISFILKTVEIDPQTDPERPISNFSEVYSFVATQDYTDISALVSDTANGFKANIEAGGYLSENLKNSITAPVDTIIPYTFNGFVLTLITANIFEITLPTMRYEIDNDPSPNTFINEYYQDNRSSAVVDSVGVKKSMRSYRSYEVGMIYRDLQCRKTTVLTSEFNTIFIPLANCITQNKITVNVPITQLAPTWAHTYKFVIKENRNTYETVYASNYYVDGEFAWVQLEGTSINKVNIGDSLLVKRDSVSLITVPTFTTVLDIVNQPTDFIVGNVDDQVPPQPITEVAGLYAKFKPEGYVIKYDGNKFKTYTFDEKSYDTPKATININPLLPYTVPEGSFVSFKLHSSFKSDEEVNDYNMSFRASSNYVTFQDFFYAQLASVIFQGNNTGVDNGGVFNKSCIGNRLHISGTSNGSNSVFNPNHAFFSGNVTVRTVLGYVIMETSSKESENNIFYESPEVFTVNPSNGQHEFVNHVLNKTFNSYVQGNGAESYQILDKFNQKYVSLDFSPTAISENEYKQEHFFADINYSGVYNSNTNVNKLNEFNLSLANFKDDIDKTFGPIMKMKGFNTNIEVFQEDKQSIIYYQKDILYNPDGSSNLTSTDKVLGTQQTYLGEYGISSDWASYDIYGGTSYNTDVKRGVVVKKSNNGLFEISSQGMKNYFKKLFRNHTINFINGQYDQYNDIYILNIQYDNTEYVTWAYSDANNGWISKISFNPEDMCRVNGNFFSFKNGRIWKHNIDKDGLVDNFNTFYGVEYPSKFQFNYSQEPSTRKNYKVLEIEGTTPLEITCQTDLEEGYINQSNFVKKEGVYYSYIRTSNTKLDTALLSCQGIGNCTVSGLVLTFSFTLDPIYSIGDSILNIDTELVGTIVSKTANTLTLNAVNNIVSGNYVMCAKTQSVENNSLLGYHLKVDASFENNKAQEIYAINAEVSKSFS